MARAQRVLPPLVTGAWSGNEGDHEPVGTLFNLMFVRGVTLCCSLLYVNAIARRGGGFSLDFGFFGESWEVLPLAVALVVGRILAPPGVYPF